MASSAVEARMFVSFFSLSPLSVLQRMIALASWQDHPSKRLDSIVPEVAHNEVEAMNQTLEFGDTHVDGASLAEVCRRYGVKELSLFGSAVRRDIDMMVEFEQGVRVRLIKFESLAEELEVLAGRTINLVSRGGLKPWVRPAVLKDARSSMRGEPSFLKDILSACRKSEAIVAATREDFCLKGDVLPPAVLHHRTVIGEAVSSLSAELRARHPDGSFGMRPSTTFPHSAGRFSTFSRLN
jgi:uncharacterized protein